MRVVIYAGRAEHQQTHAHAFCAGLRRHGIGAPILSVTSAPVECDLAVMWSARHKAHQDAAREYLVMERGYLGDRTKWTSLGFNGLNGRAEFRGIGGPERFARHFGSLKPWRRGGQYAVVMGQVPGDQSIEGVNIDAWYASAIVDAREVWGRVFFRPHPLARKVAPPGVEIIKGDLQSVLCGAGLVVTYNSNSGVDAVLAGCPTVAADRGSMAWDVSARDMQAVKPDRCEWAARLAWCQWQLSEIESGEAWARISG